MDQTEKLLQSVVENARTGVNACEQLIERTDDGNLRGELRNLRRHHPELWARLLDMDERAIAQFGDSPLGRFKDKWTVVALDERFAREEGGNTNGGIPH